MLTCPSLRWAQGQVWPCSWSQVCGVGTLPSRESGREGPDGGGLPGAGSQVGGTGLGGRPRGLWGDRSLGGRVLARTRWVSGVGGEGAADRKGRKGEAVDGPGESGLVPSHAAPGPRCDGDTRRVSLCPQRPPGSRGGSSTTAACWSAQQTLGLHGRFPWLISQATVLVRGRVSRAPTPVGRGR